MNAPNAKQFHPSAFQELVPTKNDKTMASLQKEREQRLTSNNMDTLQSPGRYQLTDADNRVSRSNTRHLFKNLYGETLLTLLFFSDENIRNIQNLIKFVVHKESGYTVDDQSTNELLVVMRSLFLEYSRHPQLIDESMPQDMKQKLYKAYTAEVARLNDILINEIVPKIISQIHQYLDYLRDSTQQSYKTEFLDSKNVSIAGERQYRSITQVLTGHQL
jgi:hypothetical protein